MDYAERLELMTHGPMHIRYFLQPAIALLLGFHAGRLDARAGSPPYVLRLLRSDPSASRCAKASSRSSSH